VARSKQNSGKKRQSPKSTAAPPGIDGAERSPGDESQGASGRAIWIAVSAVAAIVVAVGIGFYLFTVSGSGWNAREAAVATFVGSETCAGCHQAETKLWQGSHHEQAMDHASEKSVRGDFNNTSFDYYGVRSRFFRKDGKCLVETDGPDGKLATFEVKYTFGVYPLQQYLIEFADGRIQALSIAWDSRPKGQGGQRWFHLYPNEEIKHDDILHWTKLNQNWNFMCAECHSTGVKKNYDAAGDRFKTTFAEISVGCETCHGKGSGHVVWAHDRQRWWPFGKQPDKSEGLAVRFDERSDVTWRHDPRTGNPQRNFTPPVLRKEVETCGLCHARRSEFSEDWVPGRWLSDTHAVSGLDRGLYFADGQMHDEVYNYGSFKQSKMFAAGVTCSDCHDPHSDKLKVSGDGVCLQCHASDKYANVAHSHHEAVNPPIGCASCHLPARTYMVVDPRHDHSLRIPRPDLSVKLGTPNACNDCHADKLAQWASSVIEGWHGPDREGFQNYAAAFHAAWFDRPDAAQLLATVAADRNAPAFARASALTELTPRLSPANSTLAREGLSDPDPMVRIGALDMLESVPAAQIWPLASPLLSDPSIGVRIRAASLLAAIPTASQPAADRERFERAAAEFIGAQRFNDDRPGSRSALGSFFAKRGRTGDAEAEYKAALRLSPQYAPAAANLANLYRGLGREAEGESVLRAALIASPHDAGLHHALGLTLVRLKRVNDALGELQHAAELDPDHARYDYVYAVALHSAGRVSDAMTELKENLARHPDDRDTLLALITFSRDGGNAVAALEYAEQLARITPQDRGLAALIEELRRQTRKSSPDAADDHGSPPTTPQTGR
jgi:predicted CXXCH cytochrome family protein